MFLRAKKRIKDGKEHRYWSIVENRRVAGDRIVQRQVLYLGEINDSQKAAWCRSIAVLRDDEEQTEQLAIFPEDREAPVLDCDVVQVKLSGLQIKHPRQWGGCWLSLELWDQLQLDAFWEPKLPPSRKGTRWLNVLKTLVCNRLLEPGSEWRLHRHWYEASAMGDLLGEDFGVAESHKLYRRFPLSARNAEILSVAYRTDVEAIRPFVPDVLEVISDVVYIHIYKIDDADWCGPYNEANFQVGVRLSEEHSGSYSTFLFLDSASGMAQGREVHGQPKMDGEVSLKAENDLFVGRVRRNGIDVMTGTLGFKQHRADESVFTEHYDFSLSLFLKAMNHIDGTPAIRQITSRRLTDVKVHECWKGPSTVELRPNARTPAHRLPVLEMLDGFYWKADFTLVEGSTLKDLLK